MKKKESMTISEVTKAISDLREKLRVIHFGGVGSRPKNVKEVGVTRREIARMETMKTALNAKK